METNNYRYVILFTLATKDTGCSIKVTLFKENVLLHSHVHVCDDFNCLTNTDGWEDETWRCGMWGEQDAYT